MRNLRTGTPYPEDMWDKEDIMSHLKCDGYEAENIMKKCREQFGIGGYGAIEKHLILDFINEKQRQERERETRYQADLANVRQISVLEEQVKTLKEICNSSSADARKARSQSLVANIISFISLIVAILTMALK